MSDKKIERMAYRQAIMDLRDEFKNELRPTIEMLIAMRDNKEVPAKERINAAKELKVWLGVARPAEEKQASVPISSGGGEGAVSPPPSQRILDMVNQVLGVKSRQGGSTHAEIMAELERDIAMKTKMIKPLAERTESLDEEET